MKLIIYSGGLGNQMFQYAFFCANKRNFKDLRTTTLWYAFNQSHNGFELGRVFGIPPHGNIGPFGNKRRAKAEAPRKGGSAAQKSSAQQLQNVSQSNLTAFLRKAFAALPFLEFAEYPDARYCEEIFSKNAVYILSGYWQNEKYFLQSAEEIRRRFRFADFGEAVAECAAAEEAGAEADGHAAEEILAAPRGASTAEEPLASPREASAAGECAETDEPSKSSAPSEADARNRELAKRIAACEAVSIHVRRGDYAGHSWFDVVPPSYYQKAAEYIAQRTENPAFFVFSDDIEWCKASLKLPQGATFVDWNKGAQSYRDMQLMSLCRHNIITNSSFSWWGAWLNPNKQKIVVCPKTWISEEARLDFAEICPPEWIRL